MDTASIDLTVNVYDRFKKQIVFTGVWASANADLLHGDVDGYHESVFHKIKDYRKQVQAENRFQAKFNPKGEYLYALCLNEFTTIDEVEDSEGGKYSDFVLLVKSEEIDWGTFDPDEYDDSDEQYERYRDSLAA